MISLSELLVKMEQENPVKVDTNQRRSLFRELYPYYERDWKKQTWKNYQTWLRENKLRHSPENQAKFKKSKMFYAKITPASFASYWLGFMPTPHLYYLISIAKDKEQRNESFNKWLFWSLKIQN